MVGSIKTNNGHAGGGAGLTGLIKCCIQLIRQEAPACLHLRASNSWSDAEDFLVEMLQETTLVSQDGCFSTVSSFVFRNLTCMRDC